jgi:hypothetical protein
LMVRLVVLEVVWLEVVLLVVIAQTLLLVEIEWSGRPLGVAVVIGADTVTRARWAGPSLRGRITMVVLLQQNQMRRRRQKVGRLRDG